MSSTSSASARHRMTAVWVGAAVLLSIVCGAVAIGVDRVSPTETATEVATMLVIATFAVVGAIVTLSAADNNVGRLLLITAVLWACSQAMTEAGVRGLRHGSIIGANYYATFGVTLRLPTVILIGAVIPVLFPDGRAPTPRARRLVAAAAAAAVLGGLGSLLSPQESRLPHWHGVLDLTGPIAVAGQLLIMLAVLGSIVVAVGAVVGMRARWRCEGELVRQQLLLFANAAAASALFLTGVIITVFATSSGAPRWTFAVAVLPLPLAIAVATLRHGLYDLRRAADRTMLWLSLSGTVVTIYAAVVSAAAAFAPAQHGWWITALAAGVTALALVPLRDRLQRVVNRIVYGASSEPYAVLARLGEQLAAAADVDRLVDAALAELGVGLDLRDVGVTAMDGRLVGVGLSSDSVVVPLLAYGETVGQLTYRQPERTLSEAEQRLLGDLARQLGGALHARALRLDLQRTRERLVLAREEERRRLRRDLHDGLGPALAGLMLKMATARVYLPETAGESARQLDLIAEEIRLMVVDIRRLVEGLRPPALDELGLIGACEQVAERLAGTSHLRVVISADALPPLPAAVEVAVYRIVQEAVTNVVRHSHAQICTVTLKVTDNRIDVRIADDGGAAQLPGTGNGLATMRERAEELGGILSVDGGRSGIEVTASLPATGAPK